MCDGTPLGPDLNAVPPTGTTGVAVDSNGNSESEVSFSVSASTTVVRGFEDTIYFSFSPVSGLTRSPISACGASTVG